MRRAFFLRARFDTWINSLDNERRPSGTADEEVGELVEALDCAVLRGGRGRVHVLAAVVVGAVDDLDGRVAQPDHVGGALGGRNALVGVQRQQGGVADAGVHGGRSEARVGREDGEGQLGLGAGGQPGVAAGAVGVGPLDGRRAVQRWSQAPAERDAGLRSSHCPNVRRGGRTTTRPWAF
ncbi:hypothetical protein GCM10010254_48340 [Streptomyces chromofuscus]|nr:hypothetical protein GCM10010254_48340 [Streptomyces chromofuscus]